jgi:hypothetical protein
MAQGIHARRCSRLVSMAARRSGASSGLHTRRTALRVSIRVGGRVGEDKNNLCADEQANVSRFVCATKMLPERRGREPTRPDRDNLEPSGGPRDARSLHARAPPQGKPCQ